MRVREWVEKEVKDDVIARRVESISNDDGFLGRYIAEDMFEVGRF